MKREHLKFFLFQKIACITIMVSYSHISLSYLFLMSPVSNATHSNVMNTKALPC